MTLRREAFDNHLQTTSRESTKRYKASLPKGLQDRIFAQLAKLDTPRRGPIVQARNHGLFEANASFTPSFAFGVAPSWGTFLKPERGGPETDRRSPLGALRSITTLRNDCPLQCWVGVSCDRNACSKDLKRGQYIMVSHPIHLTHGEHFQVGRGQTEIIDLVQRACNNIRVSHRLSGDCRQEAKAA